MSVIVRYYYVEIVSFEVCVAVRSRKLANRVLAIVGKVVFGGFDGHSTRLIG